MTDDDIEARLRAAFRAKASAVTDGSLRPADPPRPGRRTGAHSGSARARLRRSTPLLLAAATIIAVAGTASGVSSLQGDRRPPATQVPQPSSTQLPTGIVYPTGPIATGRVVTATRSAKHRKHPSTSRTNPAGPRPSGRSTSSGAATSAEPPSPSTRTTASTPPRTSPVIGTHVVVLSGIALTVPENWAPAASGGPRAATGCLTLNGQPYRVDANGALDNCLLAVSIERNDWVDPDQEAGLPTRICGGYTDVNVRTLAAQQSVVGGVSGQYRAFGIRCTGVQLEQWSVPTGPSVTFWRHVDDISSRAAAVRAIEGANLPGPRTALPLVYHGLVCSMTPQANNDATTRMDNLAGWQSFDSFAYEYRHLDRSALTLTIPAGLAVKVVDAESGASSISVHDLLKVAAGQSGLALTPSELRTSEVYVATDGYSVTSVAVEVEHHTTARCG